MRICAFQHCSNSSYTAERWLAEECEFHNCKHMDIACDCEMPFKLFPFPTEKKDPVTRKVWIKAVYRMDSGSKKNWSPKPHDRICSNHFKDGKPTPLHPYPTENLGDVPSTVSSARRPPLCRVDLPPMKKIKREKSVSTTEIVQKSIRADHSYSTFCDSKKCQDQNKRIKELQVAYDELKESKFEQAPALTKKPIRNTLKFLATDKKVKTYTGIRSRRSFDYILQHISKSASKMRYWSGPRKTGTLTRTFLSTPKKHGPNRKLTLKEELLMVLMKLRLGLINELLGDIFGVGATLVSQIFNTWVKFLAEQLRPLIYYPVKEKVVEMFPKSLPREYRHLRCTVDCTEIFIEKPRDFELQALTWSDYKRHNTIKLFVRIAPNGMISFISDAWGGRASDQYITRESGFLDLIEPMDLIMADRGFPIQEDLILRGARLEIPPPGSGVDQMSESDVKKTKKVANVRIHVERAIGQLKHFSILSNTLPITLVPLADDIVIVCAALSNLLSPLVK